MLAPRPACAARPAMSRGAAARPVARQTTGLSHARSLRDLRSLQSHGSAERVTQAQGAVDRVNVPVIMYGLRSAKMFIQLSPTTGCAWPIHAVLRLPLAGGRRPRTLTHGRVSSNRPLSTFPSDGTSYAPLGMSHVASFGFSHRTIAPTALIDGLVYSPTAVG